MPKQGRFLESKKREILYSGAYGAGKTRVLCQKTLEHALVPGNLVGLCRKTFASMRQSTLRTLLYPDGNLPAILPPNTYHHAKQEHLIEINGGGSIYYFGLDDPLKIGSLNLGACGIDEAVELNEQDYIMLLGRLRNVADPHRQIFGACNPGAPTHFLYRRFFEQPTVHREAISTNATENIYLPIDYQESLGEFTGQSRARYVEGKWVAFEGLVYDQWDQTVYVAEQTEFVPELVVAGVDKGYPGPSAIVVIGADKNGKIRILDETYGAKMLADAVITSAQQLNERWSIERFMVDPSCAELIHQFKMAGLPARPANNDVQAGINCVAAHIRILGDGEPYLTVSPHCINLIKEFSAYRWKDKSVKEQPIKEADHALDALRYGMMEMARRLESAPLIMSLTGREPDRSREQALGLEDIPLIEELEKLDEEAIVAATRDDELWGNEE